MVFQPGSMNYTQGFGSSPDTVAFPHLDVRSPTLTDINYQIGQRWVYIGNSEWVLLSFTSIAGVLQANWGLLGSSVTDVIGTTQSLAANGSYIADAATLVTFTLPLSAPQGSTIQIVGNGAGGWTIHQNAGQVINFNAASTTVGVGGSLSSSNRYNCVELFCTIANTAWTVINNEGTLTVV